MESASSLCGASPDRLRNLADRREYSSLEEAWVEALAGGADALAGGAEPFLGAVDTLLSQGQRERASVLLDLLLPACAGRPADRAKVLRRLIVALPRRPDLRAAYAAAFREAQAGDLLAEAAFSISGVESATDPLKALATLEKILLFRPGAFVLHASGWGVGPVESVDPLLRQAVVDLEKKRHHRVDLKAAADILEPLPADHFLALAHGGPARLRELAATNPVELVGIVLSSFGNPQDLKAIKARLAPEVVPAEEWGRWWSRAKGLLRESGFFRVADRAPYSVERLQRSVTFEDELLRQFQTGDVAARLAIARKYGRERAGSFAKLRERVLVELRSLLSSGGARALEAAAVLERIDVEDQGKGAVSEVLRAEKDPAAAILAMEGGEERRRVMEVLEATAGGSWPEVALALFQRGDESLRDEAAALLGRSQAAPRALRLVAEALQTPRAAPELFSWAFKTFVGGERSPLVEPLRAQAARELLGRVFDALDHLGMRAERDGRALVRDTLGRIRSVLADEGARFFRETVKPLSRDEARTIYQRVLSSGGLSEPLRVKLLEILLGLFSDISRAQVRPIWEEDSIYVTAAGLEKRRAEFRDITEEKLPKNFQDIGRAAAFGDLSENAEYTSALEERDRLTRRATEIKAELDRVKLIVPEMVKDGEVSLGSRVSLLNVQTGQQVLYRILGPWDGGPEDGILSYRSPLAIGLLGKKVGEEVEAQLPGGTERFRIVGAASAFDPLPPPKR